MDGVVWRLDTPSKFDTFAENIGGQTRGLLFHQGETVDLIGRLHVDMLNTSKYLLNNVDFGITLELQSKEFYLKKKLATNKTILKIKDATLFIEHVKINPEVLLSHQTILEQKNAVYPYKRCDVKNFTISHNSTYFSLDNVCNGLLPELVLIALVNNQAYQGDSSLNPFNFQHFNMTSFTASVNGIEIAPRNLTFDFTQKNPISQHAYFNLFKQLNLHRFDRANQISRDIFNAGGFILAYDLTPDHDNDCANIVHTGALRFEGKFKESVNHAITVLVYLQFDADLVIDKDRNVYPQMF